MPGTSSKSLMRGSKWVRRSIYSLARFLSQHGFSCAAVQEEQLRLCVFKAFQLNSDPIKWYHQRSGFCPVVHSFHVSVNLWGPLFLFSSLKIRDPNSNRSLLTILAAPHFLPSHWLSAAFKTPWPHCFCALRRNTEILYTTWRTKTPSLKWF